ncbi:MAG: hypothetical protein WBW33_28750 [Bryobacteraceae bacterium]
MKITASTRVHVLGAILCVALVICSFNFSDKGGPSFIASLIVAGIAYLLAIREFFATSQFPRRVVVAGLALAALWHLPFLRVPPGPDDDIHRYVWDGRLQRLGYSPYVVVPSDPSVRELHTTETLGLNNPDVPSPYPAGAQFFFRAVTAIHESTFALRLAFVFCDFAIAFLLLDVLRRERSGAHWVLAYAWNPLLAVEVAGSGHIDILGALLLLVSFAALGRRWRAIAALGFALAVAVKFLPVVLLPLYWKRVRIRDALLAAAVVALLYVPFLNRGRIPIGSVGTYVQIFRFNNPVFGNLERMAPLQVAAGLAVFAGFVTATWLRIRSPECSPGAFAWPMAASLLCAPVIYPWYLLWLLPFSRSAATLPIIVWTVSIIPTYMVWHWRTLGGEWMVPGWLTLIEYGPVAIAGVLVAMRRRARPGVSQCSMDPAGA